nr:reverse transcriptase domain-containing protein [Tanacetum cinerariifolium]
MGVKNLQANVDSRLVANQANYVLREIHEGSCSMHADTRSVVAKALPRVSVKGQILADFIVKRPEEDSPDTPIEEEGKLPEPWILFTDGSSCTDGSRAGLILTNPVGMEFTYALRFRFDAINNEAEYKALISGLRIAEQMGVKNLQANVDSRLVANQVNG